MYNEIIDKIKEYDTIVIARHIGVDPDALCSQLALRDSIRLTYPDKKVLAIGTGSSKFLHFGKLDRVEKVLRILRIEDVSIVWIFHKVLILLRLIIILLLKSIVIMN